MGDTFINTDEMMTVILNYLGTDDYKNHLDSLNGETKEDGFRWACCLLPSVLISRCHLYHAKKESTDA